MLRFFRKMTKALIPENRIGMYVFYALGEIIKSLDKEAYPKNNTLQLSVRLKN